MLTTDRSLLSRCVISSLVLLSKQNEKMNNTKLTRNDMVCGRNRPHGIMLHQDYT